MKSLGIAAALAASLAATTAQAENTVRVGWCARTVSAAATPFAVATKMGWFAQAGFRVELLPFQGSTDCVKSVATWRCPEPACPSFGPPGSREPDPFGPLPDESAPPREPGSQPPPHWHTGRRPQHALGLGDEALDDGVGLAGNRLGRAFDTSRSEVNGAGAR